MGKRTLKTLIDTTVNAFESSIILTARAQDWHRALRYRSGARFTNGHLSQIIELAFLRSFLTWETFIEEAFILYLLGIESPGGFRPVRYAVPRNRQHAVDLLASDVRHTDWTAADRVIDRANRFFKGGRPFIRVIRPRTNMFNNMKTIRNAVSHASDESADKFESLVRNELTYYPRGMTPGEFLMSLVPKSTPPKTFIQYYTENLQVLARAICP
jgi:hypothetical protein